MSDLRTAALRALEALEWNLAVIEDFGDNEQLHRQHKAITALRAAQSIIQPEIKADKEPRLLPWKGLTEEEHTYYKACGFVGVKAVEEKLRARNSTLVCHQGEEGK